MFLWNYIMIERRGKLRTLPPTNTTKFLKFPRLSGLGLRTARFFNQFPEKVDNLASKINPA